MKKLFSLIIIIFSVIATSCDQEELPTQSLGEVSYYPAFLFCDADTVTLKKTIELQYNGDAKNDGTKSMAEFEFVDNDGKSISPKILQIKVNGKVSSNNRFTVDATQTSVDLEFTFLPDAPSGKHQGNLRLRSYSLLDRIDNISLDGNATDIFKWTIYFDKKWNPLQLILFWIGVIILAGLIIWFLFIRPILYPKLKVRNIQIECEPTFKTPRIKGCRKVVFTNAVRKQSLLNRIFTGEIKYIKDPCWDTEWSLGPCSKKDRVKAMGTTGYTMTPPGNTLMVHEKVQMKSIATGTVIRITIMK